MNVKNIIIVAIVAIVISLVALAVVFAGGTPHDVKIDQKTYCEHNGWKYEPKTNTCKATPADFDN